ncbi:MAG: 3-phosphoshikimate 1-carboxyvinyltransferase [Verrucomicrobiota bacterium]
MKDPFPILPFRGPARGAVALPGSKSLTNRALVLAALAEGTTTLEGVLFSRDTELMLAALERLGLALSADREARTITVQGRGGHWPVREASFDVGNAGTAARFLTALLALAPEGRYALDGDPAMRERPMAELLDALTAQGARFTFGKQPGHFPFCLESSGLAGGAVTIDAGASSQFVSALLLAAPCARADLVLRVEQLRPAFVRITTEMMSHFGARVGDSPEGMLTVGAGAGYRSPGTYAVEPDVTAASYFLALPLVTGGAVRLPGLTPNLLQGDAAFADVVAALGAEVKQSAHGWEVGAPGGTPLPGLERDFRHFSDTFLTLAALAPLAEGPTTIRGIGHTRHQETDRVAAMARELAKLGCTVTEREDSLHIVPDRAALVRAAETTVEIETYEDHRFAMSFAILGCADLRPDHGPWLRLRDPLCCRKTFPDFFTTLESLRGSHPAP